MSRNLWGEFDEDTPEEKKKPNERFVPSFIKKAKLDEVKNKQPKAPNKDVDLKVQNSLVTQTIEVMKQTEMLTSLIDTYSNKSGTSNYLLNPCQMIPEVDFPAENSTDFTNDDKFTKPIWFVPPLRTPFSKGMPKDYPELTPNICRKALRKSISGLLSMAGYTDTQESALIFFTDAAEQFIRCFMQQIREIHNNDPRLELKTNIEVTTLEKAYCNYTNSSLTQIHNYFKHHIIAKNRNEIAEFNDVFQEYDKLMKESQNLQKEEFQENEFISIIEMPSTSGVDGSSSTMEVSNQNPAPMGGNIINILDGHIPIPGKDEGQEDIIDQNSQFSNDSFLPNQ